MQYCSLHRPSLLSPLDTSTTEYRFCFGLASSFFLELFLCSSPVAYWTTGGLLFWYHIFLLFHTVHGVLEPRILEWFAFPPPVDHVLSELSTLTHLSWVALHSLAHSFTELCKSLCLDKAVIHEIILYNTIVINTCHYTFVYSHRVYIKSEP